MCVCVCVCVCVSPALAQPDEALSVAVLQPGERDRATLVHCVAGPAINAATPGSASTGEAPNAYGDVDVVVTVTCEKAAGAPSCTC